MPDEQQPIRLLIADNHPIFRDGLRKLVESERDLAIVGEAADGGQAVELAQELKPDILLLDLALAMQRPPGLDVLRRLADGDSGVRTILLTAAIERDELIKALELGARGVVLKESTTQLLFKSIRRVMAGEYWVGRDTVSDLVSALASVQTAVEKRPPGRAFGLTSREREVLELVVGGYGNKELSQKLAIAEDTVKHHLTNIFNKTGVSNRLERALFAIHHKLIEPN